MTSKNQWMNKVVLFVFSFVFFTILNIANAAPVASITGPEVILAGETVNLSGVSSTGSQIKYRWKIVLSPDGSNASLVNGTLVNTSFVVDRAGIYLVELRVLEGANWSTPKYLTITSLVSVGEIVLNPETFESSFLCKITFGLYDCDEVIRDFPIADPSGNFSLIIQNEGVKKAFLNLNGVDLTDYYQLSGANEVVVKKTSLMSQNQLKLRFGRAGSYGEFNSKLTIKIVRNLLPSGTNSAPVISANPIQYFGSLGGKTQLTITDADQVGGHLLSVLVPAKNGEVTITATGAVVYEPDSSFLGDDEVVVLVRDTGFPQKAFALIIPIHYENGNEPPILSTDVPAYSNGETIRGKIFARDTVGQTQTYAVIENPTHGTVTLDSLGNVTYVPNDNFIGLETFKIRVTDSGSPSSFADIIVPVEVQENHAPNVSSPTLILEQGTTNAANFVFNDIDPGQIVTIALKTMPLHGLATINPDGRVFYTPDALFYGDDLIEVVVRDNGHPAKETVMPLMAHVDENRPPVVFLFSSKIRVSPGITATVQFSASDPNFNQTLTKAIAQQPAHGVATVDGSIISYTPNADFFGQDEIVLTVTDNGFPVKTASATLQVIVEQNHPPVPTFTGSTITAGKDRLLYFFDNDPDAGQSHTFSISSFPSNGVITPSAIWNNAFYYKPNPGFLGNDTFEVVVTDDGQPIMSSHLTIVMSVRSNSAPVITPVGTLHIAQASRQDQNIYITDVDGDDVTLTILGTPTLISASITGKSTLSFMADKGLSGTETLTLQAKDNGNPSLTTTAQVQIVVDMNHAPVPGDQDLTVGKDQSLTIFSKANDPDPGQSATFTIASPPTHGSLNILSGGSFVYTASTGYSGDDEFNITVTDNGSPALSANSRIVLHVQQNFPPSPIARDIKILQGQPGSSQILPNDPNPNQTHLYAVVVQPTNGSLTVYPTGFITYIPNNGFIGQDQFVVSVTDSGKPALSANIVIAVEVERNLPPNPIANNLNILQGTIGQVDIQPNDPNTADQTFTYEIARAPINGILYGGYTRLYYEPSYGFSGADSFVVKVTDSGNPKLSALKTVQINVIKNITPTVIATDFATFQGKRGTTQVSFTDVEPSQDHFFSIVTQPLHGTAEIYDDGKLYYTPALNYFGNDQVEVGVRDSARPPAMGTKVISITVRANTVPTVIAASSLNTFQSTPISTPITFTDPDEGQNHITLIQAAPLHGIASINAQGILNYTPATGYFGLDAITVAVKDDSNPPGVGTKTITLTVVQNKNPVVLANNISTFQSTPASTQITFTDVEPDQQHTYFVLTPPVHGNYILGTNGLLTYTPTAGYAGSDSIVVGVRDSAIPSGEGTKEVLITVIANTMPVVSANNITIFQGATGTSQVSYIDPDVGQTHAFSVAGIALYGNVTVSDQGLATYTPFNKCVTSNDAFKIAVTDNATPAGYGEKEIQVTTTLNTLPTVAIDDFNISQFETVTKSLVVTDPDAGETFTYSILTYPQFGSVVLDPSGSVTYHNYGTSNADSFVISIRDSFGQCSGQVVNKTIHVNTQNNRAPVLAVTDLVLEQNAFGHSTVTSTDPDPFQIVAYVASIFPQHGSVVVTATGDVSYFPNSNFSGHDEFTIKVFDNGTPLLFDEKTINVTVVPLNFPPVPTANSIALLSGKIATTTVLANDSNVGQTHTFEILAPLQFGWAAIDTFGVITYHAYEGTQGSEQIQVKVTDNGQFPRSATINVPVEVVKNLAPNPAALSIANAVSGMTATANIAANDPNHARFPQVYTFRIPVQPSVGSAAIDANGNLSYSAPVDFSGNVVFDVEVLDQGTPVLIGTSHVTVNVVLNSAPTVSLQTLETTKNISIQKQIEFFDGNSSTQTFTYAIAAMPTHGNAVINASGILTYNPNLNYFGSDQLTVRVTDNGNPALSGEAIYTINVADSANTPPTMSSLTFLTAQALLPKKYEFTVNNLVDADGTVSEVRVDFGDGSDILVLNSNQAIVKSGESALNRFNHNYFANGTYQVRVTLIDNLGAQSQYIVPTVVQNNIAPVARINYSPLEGGLPLNLVVDASQSSDDGTLISLCITVLKDGISLGKQCNNSGLILNYQLTTAGTYQINGCVTDNKRTYRCSAQTIYAGVERPGYGAYLPNAVIEASSKTGNAPLNNVVLSALKSTGFNGALITDYQWAVRSFVDNKYGQNYEKFYSGVNPTVNFPYAGVYDVTLFIVDENGNQASATTKIYVKDTIQSAMNILALYQGDHSFQFKVNTFGQQLSWDKSFWEFEDGSIQRGFEASKNLNDGNLYIVKFVSYDENGNRLESIKIIDLTISPARAPIINMGFIPNLVQVNQTFTLNASGTTDAFDPSLRFRWWMGDGSEVLDGVGSNFSQITHAYSSVGDKLVRLVVTNNIGISSEFTFMIKAAIGQPPTIIASVNRKEGIAPLLINASAIANDPGGAIVSYSWTLDAWNFGRTYNGQNISGVYSKPGSYRVNVTAVDNDGNSVTQYVDTITVSGYNKAPVIADVTLQVPQNKKLTHDLSFSDSDSNAQLHSYSIVTAPTNGTASVTSEGRLVYLPNVDYLGEDSVRVRVTDSSTIPAYGEATVTIQVTGNVNINPVITGLGYNYDSASFPRQVSFGMTQLSDPDGRVVKVTWDFGDGSTQVVLESNKISKIGEISHIYKQGGAYTVLVTAEDNQGGVTTQPLNLSLGSNVMPIPRFTVAETGSGPYQLTLDASGSTDANGTITRYCWRINKDNIDLINVCDANPIKVVNVPTSGVGTLYLSIRDNSRGNSYYQSSINIGASNDYPPFTTFDTFGDRRGAVPLFVNWGSTSTVAYQNKTIVKKYWSLSESLVSDNYFENSPITALYKYPGTHMTTLTAIDSAGKFTTSNKLVYAGVDMPLVADFTATNENGQSVFFNASDWTKGHWINFFSWEFGDGSFGFERYNTHVYNQSGYFKVRLTVMDIHGTLSTKEQTIIVGDDPADATISGMFKIYQLWINPVSLEITGNMNDVVKWNFGDGTIESGLLSTKGAVTHRYADPGVYGVRASVVSDASGLTKEFFKYVVVNNEPVQPNLFITTSSLQGSVPLTVNFTSTYAASYVPTSFQWVIKNDRGNILQISNQSTPSYTFSKVGNYYVSLLTKDANSNMDVSDLFISVGSGIKKRGMHFVPKLDGPSDREQEIMNSIKKNYVTK